MVSSPNMTVYNSKMEDMEAFLSVVRLDHLFQNAILKRIEILPRASVLIITPLDKCVMLQ